MCTYYLYETMFHLDKTKKGFGMNKEINNGMVVIAAEKLSISGEMIKDAKTGKETIKISCDEKMYVDNLPEGLTLETVQAVSDYNKAYITNATTAATGTATAAFEANDKLEVVEFTIPFIGDKLNSKSSKVEIVVEKAKTTRLPGSEPKYITRPAVTVDVINKATVEESYLKLLRTGIQEKFPAIESTTK